MDSTQWVWRSLWNVVHLGEPQIKLVMTPGLKTRILLRIRSLAIASKHQESDGLDPVGVKIALEGGSSWGATDQARYDAWAQNKSIRIRSLALLGIGSA